MREIGLEASSPVALAAPAPSPSPPPHYFAGRRAAATRALINSGADLGGIGEEFDAISIANTNLVNSGADLDGIGEFGNAMAIYSYDSNSNARLFGSSSIMDNEADRTTPPRGYFRSLAETRLADSALNVVAIYNTLHGVPIHRAPIAAMGEHEEESDPMREESCWYTSDYVGQGCHSGAAISKQMAHDAAHLETERRLEALMEFGMEEEAEISIASPPSISRLSCITYGGAPENTGIIADNSEDDEEVMDDSSCSARCPVSPEACAASLLDGRGEAVLRGAHTKTLRLREVALFPPKFLAMASSLKQFLIDNKSFASEVQAIKNSVDLPAENAFQVRHTPLSPPLPLCHILHSFTHSMLPKHYFP